MKRLTPKQEAQIRHLAAENDKLKDQKLFEASCTYLFQEIEALKGERDLLKSAMNDKNSAYQLLHEACEEFKKERDQARVQLGDVHLEIGQLKAENEKLKEANNHKTMLFEVVRKERDGMAEGCAKVGLEIHKLLERIEKLRETLTRISKYYVSKSAGAQFIGARAVELAMEALEADDKLAKEKREP